MPQATVCEVDLPALAGNLKSLRSLLAPEVEVIAIAKANAYGHGAVPVCRYLSGQGVRRFAVARLEEAVALADAGILGDILILGCCEPSDAEEIAARRFEAVLTDLALARDLDRVARRMNRRIAVHVKLDTGMGRLGFQFEQAPTVASELASLGGIEVKAVMTHFSSSDNLGDPGCTGEQLDRFLACRRALDNAGLRVPHWHAANSAGILWHSRSHCTAVRPGLAMYGNYPGRDTPRQIPLRQAMTLKTRVALVRDMPAGSAISYGGAWRAEKPARIAVLPMGYADGFSRRNSNRGCVLIHGTRCPIRGRVCMDLTMVDVTHLPAVRPGDEAVVYGSQRAECIRIEEVAALCDTVPQEIMTSVSARVPRRYVGGGTA